jgi:hypothetical protein
MVSAKKIAGRYFVQFGLLYGTNRLLLEIKPRILTVSSSGECPLT